MTAQPLARNSSWQRRCEFNFLYAVMAVFPDKGKITADFIGTLPVSTPSKVSAMMPSEDIVVEVETTANLPEKA